MTIFSAIACSALGFLVAWTAIPIIQRKLAFLEKDNSAQFHHTHHVRVSRLGGVAFAAAFAAACLVICLFVPAGVTETKYRYVVCLTSLAMFLLGFWDDLCSIGARKKLAFQLLIAIAACLGGIEIQKIRNPFNGIDYYLGLWGPVVTVFWMVALTNLINLIDGIDGLAGGISLMLMGLLCYVGFGASQSFPMLCAAAMAGALIGFLRFNFPPASIYMGDGGAYFLGFLIACLSTINSQKGTIIAALLAPLFVLALPIIDVSLAILRRGLKGLPIFRPDRKHIHHRLLDFGFSRTKAVLTLYLFCAVFLVLALLVFWSNGRSAPTLFGVACLVLVISARSFNFGVEWISVGKILGNTAELRKASEYSLPLGRWLQMEAERSESIESLWSDYQFILGKLEFYEVKLTLGDEQKIWQADAPVCPADTLLRRHFEFTLGQRCSLDFAASPDVLSPVLFEHLCDIASEAWHKSAARWQKVRQLPIRFDSTVALPAAPRPSYVPLPQGAGQS